MKTFAEYEAAARRTMNTETPCRERLVWNALGLAGEAGEVVDAIKKHVYHDHPTSGHKMMSEIGDVLWYLAALAQACGGSLEDAASMNIEKLKIRYPDGFSTEASLARVDVKENDDALRNRLRASRARSACHGEPRAHALWPGLARRA